MAQDDFSTRPEDIKFFDCLTELSMKFILLIIVKMPTIVGILTLISSANTSESFRHIFYYSVFCFLNFHAQLN